MFPVLVPSSVVVTKANSSFDSSNIKATFVCTPRSNTMPMSLPTVESVPDDESNPPAP